jgi:phosphoribosylamine--glycine ligase
MATDILVVGSGGREHALVWKLQQSPRVGKVYVAPGNGGTFLCAENVPIEASDFQKLAAFASEKKVGLTVVGPDDIFAAGIVDFFQSRKLRIWGPTKEAAQIEWSKSFSKQFMREGGIPTAEFQVFTGAPQALAYARTRGLPIVVKASGLALGKGVYICKSDEELQQAIDDIMVKKVHKDAGSEVVVEDFLQGEEISIHALSNGVDYLLFPPSQDHKRALDGDQGPNTGGMGVITPLPWVTDEMMSQIRNQVVAPSFETFRKRGIFYSGVLYPGLMMTAQGPRVLEFNARFGDPECQAYMRLLESDVLDLLEACIDGDIGALKNSVTWRNGFAVNLVVASGGYPEKYEKGYPITGLKEAGKVDGVVVFHAGTRLEGEQVLTSGGRVLGVSAVGASLKEALERAYKAADFIQFTGKYYRKDIGAKALTR